jgi:hypothetical protein
MSDLRLESDLHQDQHRSRSGLIYGHCPISHEEPSVDVPSFARSLTAHRVGGL